MSAPVETQEGQMTLQQEKLRNMCLKYAPEKLPLLGSLFQRYRGQEDQLLQGLIAKYGPEPTPEEIVALRSAPPEPAPISSASHNTSVQSSLEVSGVSSTPGTPLSNGAALASKISPDAGEQPSAESERYQQRITYIFLKHCPQEMRNLPHILERAKGREAQLIVELIQQHGEEPTVEECAQIDHDLENMKRMRTLSQMGPRAQPLQPLPNEESRSSAADLKREESTETIMMRAIPTLPLEPSQNKAQFRERLYQFYRKYNPQKLGQIDSMLKAAQGHEEAAITILISKYGPEPTPEEIARMNHWDVREKQVKVQQSPQITPAPEGQAKISGENLFSDSRRSSTFATPAPPNDTTYSRSSFNKTPSSTSAAGDTSIPSQTYATRIANMLLKYDFEKMSKLSNLLSKFKGKEQDVLDSMIRHYGPEPTLTEIAILQKQKQENSDQMGTCYQMYRTRVSSMLRRYRPNKLGTEDTILSIYKGKEEELMKAMIAKYGPEPPLQHSLAPIPDFRARVGNMYIKYAPQKLTDLSHDVLKHIGREEVHMKELVAQYGPEPSEAEILGIISAPGNYQNRILRMYQTYLANKIEDIESIYATHRDRKVELLYNLMLTFGPEPSNNSAYESHKKMLPTDKPSLRSRIKEMYAAYDPDMLALLETIFHQYAGREQILLNELIKSYGPEVPISSRSGPPSEILETYHKRVRHYYNKYERNPLDADIFIQLYKGREEEMMRILYARYGKDPDEELAIIPYRNRVIEYYKKYEPSLLSKVDETLAQFAGQEEMLLDALRARYEKCTPVPVEAPPIQRIRKMYETYDSSMLCNMDHILLKYKGRENELLQKLIAKHGPEPEEPRVLTPPAQPEPTPVEEIPSKTELVVNEPQSIQEETKPEQKQAESDTLSKIISSHSSTSKDTVDIKTRVMHMFMRYDPERLPCVESIMGQYVGKEDEIIKHLVNVYGPEPSVGDVAWHVFLAANDRDKSESKSSLGNGSAKTVEDKMDLRTCMNNFCVRYDPDLIALMDDMFSRYAKQFEERVQSLFGSVSTQCSKTSSVEKVVQSYYPRLRNFFIKYAPGRVGTEDEVLKAHEGFEEEMMISFTRLYGPEPTGGEIGMMKTYYKPLFRKRVIALLSKYDPNQLESVDTLLATFDGAEDELLRHLVVKYGPEPTEQERLAELAQQRMAASMSLSGMELDTRARVINILSKYAPSRLAEVDGMVEVFKGKEEDLFRELTAMYRIEPTKEEALSKKCATAMRGPTPGSSRTDSQMSTTPCRSLDSPAPQPDLPSSLQRPTTISETRCNSNVVSAANMNRASLVHVPAPGPSASTSFAPKQVVSTGAEQVFTRPPPNMPQQPPTPTAPQLQMDYRTRVCNFFTKYDPGNLPLLDEILEAYEGEEEHLLREMFLRYGPEPSNVEVAEVLRVAWVMYYREKLSELYSAHDPERLKCIDEDLEKYAGHEAELLESLTFLYSDIEMRKKAGESHVL